MCIAIYSPKTADEISYEVFDRCARQNNDGMGLMWVQDGKIEMYKTMCADAWGHFKGKGDPSDFDDDVEKFWQVYKGVREMGFDSVIHFRYMTHGKVCIANTHPFFIDDDRTMAFVHNGILSVPSTHEVSDTRMFGEHVLRMLKPGWLDMPITRGAVEDLMGGSKIITMDNTGRVDILNEKRGIWDQGNWYSNDGYKGARSWPSYSGSHGSRGRSVRSGWSDGQYEFQQQWHGTEAATQGTAAAGTSRSTAGQGAGKGTQSALTTLGEVIANCPLDLKDIPLLGAPKSSRKKSRVAPPGGDFADPLAFWLSHGGAGFRQVLACTACKTRHEPDMDPRDIEAIDMDTLYGLGSGAMCEFCSEDFTDVIRDYEDSLPLDDDVAEREEIRNAHADPVTADLEHLAGELSEQDRERIERDALTTDEVAMMSEAAWEVYSGRVDRRLALKKLIESEGGNPTTVDDMTSNEIQYELWLRRYADTPAPVITAEEIVREREKVEAERVMRGDPVIDYCDPCRAGENVDLVGPYAD